MFDATAVSRVAAGGTAPSDRVDVANTFVSVAGIVERQKIPPNDEPWSCMVAAIS